jgi:hypothetical protein
MRVRMVHIVLSLLFISGCSKEHVSNNTSSDRIVGNWVVKTHVSGAWPYPEESNQPLYDYSKAYSESIQLTAYANDTFHITFGSDGNYSYARPTGGYSFPSPGVILFTPFVLIQNQGPYRILNDSEIVIKPDTADLLDFLSLSASNSISHISSDTIHFYFNSDDSLMVLQRWVGPNEYDPRSPSCIYQTFTQFKRND